MATSKGQFRAALDLQAANITQKAMLDVLTTKVVRAQQILKALPVYENDDSQSNAIRETLDVLSMDRHTAQEMRATYEFPDEDIQRILDRAVNEMTVVLLGPKS